jgi:hypothetical protein
MDDLHTIALDEKRTEEIRNGTVMTVGIIFYNVKKERLEFDHPTGSSDEEFRAIMHKFLPNAGFAERDDDQNSPMPTTARDRPRLSFRVPKFQEFRDGFDLEDRRSYFLGLGGFSGLRGGGGGT